ncbi:unnamed protein product [Rhizophagus irregularis]|nr:unnamed protein product [Rhizophagus irregularis]CAB4443483.1 unnamed protein product [Rhizophagus irregularis]
MKPYLTGNSDGYLRIKEHVNSKTITDQSSVNKIFKTVATTSTYDSDDNFSNTSDDTVYFKEEEGTNESTEEVSKKSKVNTSTKPTLAKVNDDVDMYFDKANEEDPLLQRLWPGPDNTHDGDSNSCNDNS